MSRFSGVYAPGARARVREMKRLDARARDDLTLLERTRKFRLARAAVQAAVRAARSDREELS